MEMRRKAVADAIKRLFKSDWFSIYTVRECMDVIGASPTQDFTTLALYHGARFTDIDQQTKKWIFEKTIDNICNTSQFPELISFLQEESIYNEVKPLSTKLMKYTKFFS